jgi:hypothetical protein
MLTIECKCVTERIGQRALKEGTTVTVVTVEGTEGSLKVGSFLNASTKLPKFVGGVRFLFGLAYAIWVMGGTTHVTERLSLDCTFRNRNADVLETAVEYKQAF